MSCKHALWRLCVNKWLICIWLMIGLCQFIGCLLNTVIARLGHRPRCESYSTVLHREELFLCANHLWTVWLSRSEQGKGSCATVFSCHFALKYFPIKNGRNPPPLQLCHFYSVGFVLVRATVQNNLIKPLLSFLSICSSDFYAEEVCCSVSLESWGSGWPHGCWEPLLRWSPPRPALPSLCRAGALPSPPSNHSSQAGEAATHRRELYINSEQRREGRRRRGGKTPWKLGGSRNRKGVTEPWQTATLCLEEKLFLSRGEGKRRVPEDAQAGVRLLGAKTAHR